MSEKRKVSAAVKKQVAGTQRFTCASNVEGYSCPLNGNPFDEAGFEIDHIKPLSEGGSNEPSNLQALCLMCHRVKSNRASTGKEKPKKEKKVKEDVKPKEEEPIYWDPNMFVGGLITYPKKLKWKVGTNSLQFMTWRKQFGYSDNPDNEGCYVKL